MCSGGRSKSSAPEPVQKVPQVLRNRYMEERMGLGNRGIGALTLRASDRLSFSAGGSVMPNDQINQLRMGSAQGTGEFTELSKGAKWLAAEKDRRLKATKAYQAAEKKKRAEAAIARADARGGHR